MHSKHPKPTNPHGQDPAQPDAKGNPVRHAPRHKSAIALTAVILDFVGLVFVLVDDSVTSLPDPAGGTFAACCGDLDRLLPLETELSLDVGLELEVLGRVEAYEDVDFAPEEMTALTRDIAALRPFARPGPELHGLDRLRVMAERCAAIPGSKIRSLGD